LVWDIDTQVQLVFNQQQTKLLAVCGALKNTAAHALVQPQSANVFAISRKPNAASAQASSTVMRETDTAKTEPA